jgi:hypothetical protein
MYFRILFIVLTILLITGCTEKDGKQVGKILLPEGPPRIKYIPRDISDFVTREDLKRVDWDKKAEPFGDRGMIGNKAVSGVIGSEMPSLKKQKWMWHVFGNDSLVGKTLKVVGFHKGTGSLHPILVDGWELELWGPNNGAAAHAPSTVQIPKPGTWAILLYTEAGLLDTLIFEIKK